MRYKDQIDIVIAAEDIPLINTALDTLETKLSFLQSLDPAALKRMAHFGTKNESFVLGAFEAARQNSDIVPSGLNLDAMERDRVAREQLAPIAQRVQRLHEKLTHTRMILGVDMYGAARAIYKALQEFGRDSGLSALVEDLGRRFKGQGSKKSGINPTAGGATTV
ncbi:hypothetical protein ACXR0O_07250 [Verrucomicrobiota bacterium sgz303538]